MSTQRLIILVAISCMLWLSYDCFGQDTVRLSTLTPSQSLCGMVRISEEEKNLSITDFLNKERGPSLSCDAQTNLNKSYWLTVYLLNDLLDDQTWYIHNDYNDIQILSVLDSAKNITAQYKSGSKVSSAYFQFAGIYFYNAITIPKGETVLLVILVKSEKKTPPSMGLKLDDENAFTRSQLNFVHDRFTSIVFVIIFLGALSFAFLFMLFLYIKNQQIVYAYYSLYLLGNILYGATKLPAITFIGNLLGFVPSAKYYLIEPLQFLTFAAYNYFVIELLNLNQREKVLAKWIKLVAFIYIGNAFINFLLEVYWPNPIARDFLFIGIRVLFFPINMLFMVWIYKKVKSPITHYFIAGITFFMIGSIISSYYHFDFDAFARLNLGLKVFNVFQIGVLLEVLCFSFALGYKIKITEDERKENQEAYINQLQANQTLVKRANEELEEKVKIRSEELIAINRKIDIEKAAAHRAELERKLVEAEMMALRAQMNPHFLFNSLNSIKYFIMSNQNDKASGYLSRFSKLIRQILDHSTNNIIPLEAELAALQLYLEIEANRFDDKFTFTIDVEEAVQLSAISIPPLLLQPFVENAIWHGLLNSTLPEKRLTISVGVDEANNDFVFCIEDNGIGREQAKLLKSKSVRSHQSLGIGLTENRIQLLNKQAKDSIRLEVIDLYNGEIPSGTKVIIRLKMFNESTIS